MMDSDSELMQPPHTQTPRVDVPSIERTGSELIVRLMRGGQVVEHVYEGFAQVSALPSALRARYAHRIRYLDMAPEGELYVLRQLRVPALTLRDPEPAWVGLSRAEFLRLHFLLWNDPQPPE